MNKTNLKIAIASDHAGFRYKEQIKELLISKGYEIKDVGTYSEEPVDYPQFIRTTAEAVSRGECDLGVIFGGSGNGEAIVANKVKGIRCAVCWNRESARFAKEHNDANIISIGQRMMDVETARNIVNTWLSAEFEGGRHEKRIEQIEQ